VKPGTVVRRAIIALLLLGLAGLPAPLSAAAPTVIVLSWDGLRWDYPDKREFPGMRRLEREGLRAERLVAGWPSATFPGHVTLATGTWADVHGIVNNRFVDRARGLYDYEKEADWIEAEPLWITAERQGVKAAAYFWVGSETDWHGRAATYRVTPFDNTVTERVKVDAILGWLDLPEAERPHLIMSYWRGADSVGHDHGPDSPRVLDALAQQDAELVRLMEGIEVRGLWPSTTLLLVGDHGMSEIGDFFDLDAFLDAHGTPGRYAVNGPLVQLFLENPAQAVAVADALDAAPALRAYVGAELPAAMRLRHPSRTGDVVVVAEAPWIISTVPWYQRWLYLGLRACCGIARGTHGWDPSLPDMGTVLMARGRGVAAGSRIPAVSQIDVAPTVARLLGIEPPQHSEGTPIAAIAVEAP